jgi:hypothetical protein
VRAHRRAYDAATFFLLALIVAVPSLLAWLLGRATRLRRWPDRRPLALIGALTVATGIAAATGRDTGVHTGPYLAGIAVGAVFLAALPLTAYYALGRWTRIHAGFVAMIWLVSLAPLALYWIYALLVTVALVGCPPDAYECPT